MRKNDAKTLLGLLGECCCCDCPPTAPQPAPERRVRGILDTALIPLPGMPAIQRVPPPDEPFIPLPVSFDTPQRPGLFKASAMHRPRTEHPGIFAGEEPLPGSSSMALSIVLDDGKIVFPKGMGGVEHDERIVYGRLARFKEAAPLDPPAVQLERNADRRSRRYPGTAYTDDNGELRVYTNWSYSEGGEVGVNARSGGVNTNTIYEAVTHFDGSETERVIRTDAQQVNAWDFQWKAKFKDHRFSVYDRISKGQYVGPDWQVESERIPASVETTDAEGRKVSAAYREQIIRSISATGLVVEDTVIQGHFTDLWLAGDLKVGQGDSWMERDVEVTQVIERHFVNSPPLPPDTVDRTLVNAWMPIAWLTDDDTFPAPAPDPEKPPGTPEYWDDGTVRAYILQRLNARTGMVLRDRELGEWPNIQELPVKRFVGANGDVFVQGLLSPDHARLDQGAALTAFGQQFSGGTWAALRDAPRRLEDDTWDFSGVIVLHANADTVTAVRPGKDPEVCTVAEFETEVLRVPAGSFNGFSSVGMHNHSWPPEWAWCDCGTDELTHFRAVIAHDAWRDSYKRDPPENSPLTWEWAERPGRKPKQEVDTAPREKLGVTLADVTDNVTQDDPVPKGEGPVRPPVQASANGKDVLSRVAKRLLFAQDDIPDERNDRTHVTDAVTVRFDPLPQPFKLTEGMTVKHEAVLFLRYKGKASSIRVNGTEVPLVKLGHNEEEPGGWHPYLATAPPSTAYFLEFDGKISLIGQCVRAFISGDGEAN